MPLEGGGSVDLDLMLAAHSAAREAQAWHQILLHDDRVLFVLTARPSDRVPR